MKFYRKKRDELGFNRKTIKKFTRSILIFSSESRLEDRLEGQGALVQPGDVVEGGLAGFRVWLHPASPKQWPILFKNVRIKFWFSKKKAFLQYTWSSGLVRRKRGTALPAQEFLRRSDGFQCRSTVKEVVRKCVLREHVQVIAAKIDWTWLLMVTKLYAQSNCLKKLARMCSWSLNFPWESMNLSGLKVSASGPKVLLDMWMAPWYPYTCSIPTNTLAQQCGNNVLKPVFPLGSGTLWTPCPESASVTGWGPCEDCAS